MQATTEPSVSFSEAEDRRDAMHRTIDEWLAELTELVDEARTSEAFEAWLDIQSRFHSYSARNALLIARQHPEATRVAGYRTWREEFDRYVKQGEQAIWIWAPIIARRCPACERSKRYHEASDCSYEEQSPDAWPKGLVGFKPVSVFDVSQTEGEPLAELETAADGDGGALVSALLDVADSLGLEVAVVSADDWLHGEAKGVCYRRHEHAKQSVVEVKARPNDADLATTLIHEFAHAKLHFDIDESDEREKREVEAEAVAYVVGRHFGLDTSNSAFYLAAWTGEKPETIQDRLDRISEAARDFIELLEC